MCQWEKNTTVIELYVWASNDAQDLFINNNNIIIVIMYR